jgi:cell division protein FtsB
VKSRKPPVLMPILRRAAMPALCLCIMAFFGLNAVLGPNGITALGVYQHALADKQAQYAALDHQRAALANRVKLVDPNRADPDMADELVHKGLNVAQPDEVIVPLK